MHLRKIVLSLCVAVPLGGSVHGAEPSIPAGSLGEIGVHAAFEKFRIYSEVCSEVMPEARAEFDVFMAAFSVRMKRLGAEVLATDEYRLMTTLPVQESLVEAFKQEFENTRRYHRSSSVGTMQAGCRAAHANFMQASDSHWKRSIASALTELRQTGKPFGAAPLGN